jgi:hypothetical protein
LRCDGNVILAISGKWRRQRAVILGDPLGDFKLHHWVTAQTNVTATAEPPAKDATRGMAKRAP